MSILKKLKAIVQADKAEVERPPGIPDPPDDSGWQLRRGDLRHFDLTPMAQAGILGRREKKDEMDRESMAEFLKSFGEED